MTFQWGHRHPVLRLDPARLTKIVTIAGAMQTAGGAIQALGTSVVRELDIADEWLLVHALQELRRLIPEHASQLPVARLCELEVQLGQALRDAHLAPGTTFGVPW